jgi:hypothetical protein
MPNYRYQQLPGIDMLNEQTNEYITVKQCTSVANQYGRKFVLSETYGCTGWAFTFEGQKWMGDFQYVLGVNLRSQHLALYSIKGCRKRDYPPVFNYNTSWWKYNHVMEDYFARLSSVLTEGRPIRDVLVLHPSSTAWSMVGTGPFGFPARGKDRDVSATNTFGHEFNAFLGKLLRAHYDFDLGDEIILAETGEIRGGNLAVNLVEYPIVVIPVIQTMLSSTFRLLSDFLEAGGKVIAVGQRPTMIEGRQSDLLSKLYDHANMTVVVDIEDTVTALERIQPRRVSLTNTQSIEANEMLYMLREIGDCRVLFVVNNDRKGTHRISITMEGTGSVEEWNALTGEAKDVEIVVRDGYVHFEDVFGPADSKLYIMNANKSVENHPVLGRSSADETSVTVVELGPVCRFTRSMPNVLTLDTCSYRLGDGGWSEVAGVWQAQRAVRDALGMRQVYYNGLEQRYKWIDEPHPENGTSAVFRFTFQVSVMPSDDVYLIVESAEYYDIQLNGEMISNLPVGWFLDRTFDKVLLHGLREGANELLLSCKYHNCMEVEDIYLIGDFGVDADRAVVAEPETLKFGDWCLQGYFHYCGSMIYHFDVIVENNAKNRMVLELGDYSAVTVEVRVNGRTAGHVPWRAANQLDLTEHLNDEANQIEIEVMGSPRNMLGPFHHTAGDTSTTNWASFRKEGDDYTPEYKLRSYGLFDQIKLYRI